MEVENAADSRANPYSSDYVTFRLDLLEQKVRYNTMP